MSMVLEDVLVRIKQLPPAEIALLRDLLNSGLSVEPTDSPSERNLEEMAQTVFGANTANPLSNSAKPPQDRLTPIPVPDQSSALKWLAENARAYKGQWVALDGERLIAHGNDAREVYAAARADGAYLPLVELVEDPDGPPFAGF